VRKFTGSSTALLGAAALAATIHLFLGVSARSSETRAIERAHDAEITAVAASGAGAALAGVQERAFADVELLGQIGEARSRAALISPIEPAVSNEVHETTARAEVTAAGRISNLYGAMVDPDRAEGLDELALSILTAVPEDRSSEMKRAAALREAAAGHHRTGDAATFGLLLAALAAVLVGTGAVEGLGLLRRGGIVALVLSAAAAVFAAFL
jgi:hypothetical protein